MKLLLIILVLFLISGCATSRPRTEDKIRRNPVIWESQAKEKDELYPEDKAKAIKAEIILEGMTDKEVIEAIGLPFHVSPYKNTEAWWYPDRKFIYFKDGKVTEATFPIAIPKGEL